MFYNHIIAKLKDELQTNNYQLLSVLNIWFVIINQGFLLLKLTRLNKERKRRLNVLKYIFKLSFLNIKLAN